MRELVAYADKTHNGTTPNAASYGSLYAFRLQQAVASEWVLDTEPDTPIPYPYTSFLQMARVLAWIDPPVSFDTWCPDLWKVVTTDTNDTNVRHMASVVAFYTSRLAGVLFGCQPIPETKQSGPYSHVTHRAEHMRYAVGVKHLSSLESLRRPNYISALRVELAARACIQLDPRGEPRAFVTLHITGPTTRSFFQQLVLYNVLNHVRMWTLHFIVNGTEIAFKHPRDSPDSRPRFDRDGLFTFPTGATLCGKGIHSKLTVVWATTECQGFVELPEYDFDCIPPRILFDNETVTRVVAASMRSQFADFVPVGHDSISRNVTDVVVYYGLRDFEGMCDHASLLEILQDGHAMWPLVIAARALLSDGELIANRTLEMEQYVTTRFPSSNDVGGKDEYCAEVPQSRPSTPPCNDSDEDLVAAVEGWSPMMPSRDTDPFPDISGWEKIVCPPPGPKVSRYIVQNALGEAAGEEDIQRLIRSRRRHATS
jgi:hypothetical protein